ncbi:MAG: hypothetical protein V1781_08395 [Bacteroidota bacterium]
MNKLVTCIIALCILSIITTAQDTTNKVSVSVRYSPTSNFKINFLGLSDFIVEGVGDKMNAELNTGSYTADIIGRYFLSEQLSARIGIGMGSLKLKFYNTDTHSNGDTDLFEGNLKQTRLTFMPAIERHFKNNKLEILTGLGLPIGIIGKTTASVKDTYTYVNPNSTDIYENTFEVPGGFGFGFQSFAGFNFYITDKFAIGTEISYGIGYTKAGGKIIITENDYGNNNTYANDELKVNGFSMSPLNGALMLTMNF